MLPESVLADSWIIRPFTAFHTNGPVTEKARQMNVLSWQHATTRSHQRLVVNTPLRHSGMARVLKGSHGLPAHPAYIHEPYLPLPSQPKLVLIYRPHRDGRPELAWMAGYILR